MKIKDLFKPEVQDILTEESLLAIQEAFDKRLKELVTEALQDQDTVYAEKLEQLIATLDADRSKKMIRIMESEDRDKTQKLVKLVKQHNRELQNEAKALKKMLVTTINDYIEEFLEESVAKNDIAQAVKNTTAYNILGNLRKVLGVDIGFVQESFSEGILDGKKKMVALEESNKELKDNYKALYEKNQALETKVLLENKISGMPEAKKNFLKKTLQDKSAKFIEENFEYTVRLFDKQENQQRKTLKEEALEKRVEKPDVIPNQKVVQEKVNKDNSHTDMYVEELSKQW